MIKSDRNVAWSRKDGFSLLTNVTVVVAVHSPPAVIQAEEFVIACVCVKYIVNCVLIQEAEALLSRVVVATVSFHSCGCRLATALRNSLDSVCGRMWLPPTESENTANHSQSLASTEPRELSAGSSMT